MHKQSSRIVLIGGCAALAAALAAAWVTSVYREANARAAMLPDAVMTVLPQAKALSGFSLQRADGSVFDLGSVQGKWSFVFFGFTHCPDICPTTLAQLTDVRKAIERETPAEDTQFVFVSVDPQRDSLGHLQKYVRFFDPEFIGVTGDPVEINRLSAQLGAAYQVEYREGEEDYPVYHTTAVFLLNPAASYIGVFTPPLDAEAIARRFLQLREIAADLAG